MIDVVKLDDRDTVAIVTTKMQPGRTILGVLVIDPIPVGHKMALETIEEGAPVLKYGQAIGVAIRRIEPGEHVHSHNLAAGERIGLPVGAAHPAIPPASSPTADVFRGYLRANGRVGTRNAIGIIASVNCSATVVRRIARHFEDRPLPGIDAVVPFTHGRGCGMAKSGEGMEMLQRTLAGYAGHPNFGGVLMVGLGCEVAQIGDILAAQGLSVGDRLRSLTIQETGGTAATIAHGIAIVEELAGIAGQDRRTDRPVSDLVLGLQCGGSDGFSGVTANPALGAASDLLVAAGGTTILSETPEIYGAEHLLLARADSARVRQRLVDRIRWWEDYAGRHGASLDNNPSPGNKAGGITTIYEKSLGAVAKAGTSPLRDVTLYGERARNTGLVFMDSPGYDPCSATGQIAAGATLLAFTTGRGSTFGAQPTPCLKLSSNADLARRMADDVDRDCSPILDGMSVAEMGRIIFDDLIATASGRRTRSEELGLGDNEFVPWDLGAWL